MSTPQGQQKGRPGRLQSIVCWAAAGVAVAAAVFIATAFALLPFANRAPADDAPIVVACLMMLALGVLAAGVSAALYAGLLTGTGLAWLWRRHHRRGVPEPPGQPLPGKRLPPGAGGGPGSVRPAGP